MEYFDFETDFENLDERSVFANRICKLIFEKHSGDLDKAIVEAEPYFNDLEEFVRNIYELVENEIPLYAYYRLLKYGADNWGFEENEYQSKIEKTRNACRLYLMERKTTSKPLLPANISKNAGVLKVYLELDGKPPKYLKVYTDGESKGEVYRSSDKKEFVKIETNFSMQIYELIYKHILGSDIEHWMLWERREDFLKYCR